MTLLDVVLLLVAAAAGVAGWAMGFLSRFMSWLGLVGGLVAASSVLPGLLTWLDHLDEQWLMVVAILVVVAFAMLGQALGMVAGNHLRVRLDPRWDRLDAAGGALMGVAGIVLVVWLLAPAVRTVPGWSADQVADSVVVAAIEGATPEPPDTFRTLRRIVGAEQFPAVFAGATPGVEVGDPPATVPIAGTTVAEASSAVVRIRAVACGRRQDGSGFFVQRGVVVTNAHVVAGSSDITVTIDGGAESVAQVVGYDPDRDLAVLVVDTVATPAVLGLGEGTAGDLAVVVAHPLGGDLEVEPARIAERVRAQGRDLYDLHDTSRQVFFLAASLEPGDSGGPLVSVDGQAVGVVFAISPDDPDVAFALTAAEVESLLAEIALDTEVDTGACL
jgi:S1-C subfamily serine protease